MSETTTTPNPVEAAYQDPVELVKNAVKELQAKKTDLEKQIQDIDEQLEAIAATITGTPKKNKPGRKPGTKAKAKKSPGRKATPVDEGDKKQLLAAMKEIGDKMRSSAAYKKAGLNKNQGKKVLAALREDGQAVVSGPWISLA